MFACGGGKARSTALIRQRFKYSNITGIIILLIAIILPKYSVGQCVCADFPDYVCINPTSSTNLRSLIIQGKLLDYADAANTPQNIIVTAGSILDFTDPLNQTDPYIFATGSNIILLADIIVLIPKEVVFDGATVRGGWNCNGWSNWDKMLVTPTGIIRIINGSKIMHSCGGVVIQNGAKAELTNSFYFNNTNSINITGPDTEIFGGEISHNEFRNSSINGGKLSCGNSTAITISNMNDITIGNDDVGNVDLIRDYRMGIDLINTNATVRNTKFIGQGYGIIGSSAIRSRSNNGTYNLEVKGLGGANTSPNTISEYYLGIETENVNLFLENSRITSCQELVQLAGIKGNQNPTPPILPLPISLHLKNNYFSRFASSGVRCNAAFSNFNVENNEFRDTLDDYTFPNRVCFFWNQSVMLNNAIGRIENNKFYDDFKPTPTVDPQFLAYEHVGMRIATGSKLQVTSNLFFQNYSSSTSSLIAKHKYLAIGIFDGSGCYFMDNTVTSVSRRPSYIGIQTKNAASNYYLCNYANNMDVGIEFEGTCNADERVVYNELNNNNIGFRLASDMTMIGLQTFKRNKWPSSFGTEAIFEGNLTPFALAQSRFTVYQPDITTNEEWPSPRIPATNWFIPVQLTYPQDLISCTYLFPPNPPGDVPNLFKSDVDAINGAFEDFKNYEASGWEARLRAYEHLHYNATLRPANSTGADFYAFHETGNLGKAFRLKDGLSQLWAGNNALSSAWAVNQNSIASKRVEIRTQEVLLRNTTDSAQRLQITQLLAILRNELQGLQYDNQSLATQLTTWIDGKLNQLSTDLAAFSAGNLWENNLKSVVSIWVNRLQNRAKDWTSTQLSTLTSIANQCRYEGGIGVVMARAGIDKYENNDDLTCPGVAPRDAEKNEGNIRFWVSPNPANDACIIRFHSPVSGQVRVFNIEGQEVVNLELDKSVLVQINTSSFKQGIYFIYVLDATNQMNSINKLLIQH